MESGYNYQMDNCAIIHQDKRYEGEVENEYLSIPMQNMSTLFEQAILSVSLNPSAISG